MFPDKDEMKATCGPEYEVPDSAIVLRAPYALSSTEVMYGAIRRLRP